MCLGTVQQYPGADKDGTMKDPFDLDAYLTSHVPDAVVIKNRLSVMLRRMKEAGTDAALTQNEIADAAMTVCDRTQYAYLKGGGSPEDKRYSELGKLGRELYEKLPEDMRKSADERRFAAGDLRGALFSDSAAEGLGRSLEKANKGVWFGSKEFDAVREAVKRLRERQEKMAQTTESELTRAELGELRQDYEAAAEAARRYIQKKSGEGVLDEKGEKRVEAVRAVLEGLERSKLLDMEARANMPREPESRAAEALQSLRDSIQDSRKTGKDVYPELLRQGKRLIAEAEGGAGTERMQEIVKNPGFMLAMSRLATDPNIREKVLKGSPEEVSRRLLKFANEAQRVNTMHEAAQDLRVLAASGSLTEREGLARLSESLSYLLAADRMAEQSGNKLMDPPEERVIREKQREIMAGEDFKSMVYTVAHASNAGKALNAIVKDARQGGGAEVLKSLLKSTGGAGRAERSAALDEALREKQREVPEMSSLERGEKAAVEKGKQRNDQMK